MKVSERHTEPKKSWNEVVFAFSTQTHQFHLFKTNKEVTLKTRETFFTYRNPQKLNLSKIGYSWASNLCSCRSVWSGKHLAAQRTSCLWIFSNFFTKECCVTNGLLSRWFGLFCNSARVNFNSLNKWQKLCNNYCRCTDLILQNFFSANDKVTQVILQCATLKNYHATFVSVFCLKSVSYHYHTSSWLITIKTERLKSALYLRLKKRKTFFWKKPEILNFLLFRKMSHSAKKCKTGDPLGFINIYSVAKYQKTRKGESFDTLKIFRKSQCQKKSKGGTL